MLQFGSRHFGLDVCFNSRLFSLWTPPPQDPSYPVYVDTSVMMGMTGDHNGTGFDGIEYMVGGWSQATVQSTQT